MRCNPWAGTDGPARRRSRAAKMSGSRSGRMRSWPISNNVPVIVRTMYWRNPLPRIRKTHSVPDRSHDASKIVRRRSSISVAVAQKEVKSWVPRKYTVARSIASSQMGYRKANAYLQRNGLTTASRQTRYSYVFERADRRA